MTVRVLPDDDAGVRVLEAVGELDVTTAPPVVAAAAALLQGARGIVLDLSAVTFLDSAGVRLVDRLARQAGRLGVGYRVVAPPATTARRVLELVGLAGLLAVDDRAAALAAVRPAPPQH